MITFHFIVFSLLIFFDMASPVRLEDKKTCQALSNLWSPKEWFTDHDLTYVEIYNPYVRLYNFELCTYSSIHITVIDCTG